MLHFLFPDQGSGFCVTGKIEAGYIQTGEKTLAMPPNETCTVKGTHRVFAVSLALVADRDTSTLARLHESYRAFSS